MIVAGTQEFRSFAEKESIIQKIRRKFRDVRFSFTDNLVIYQYDDGIKQEKPTYKLVNK